jgi:hypothetical protein
MKYTKREFIGSAVTAAVGMGLSRPFSLLADGNFPAAAKPGVAGNGDRPWHPAKGILTTPWTDQVTPEKVWPE